MNGWKPNCCKATGLLRFSNRDSSAKIAGKKHKTIVNSRCHSIFYCTINLYLVTQKRLIKIGDVSSKVFLSCGIN